MALRCIGVQYICEIATNTHLTLWFAEQSDPSFDTNKTTPPSYIFTADKEKMSEALLQNYVVPKTILEVRPYLCICVLCASRLAHCPLPGSN